MRLRAIGAGVLALVVVVALAAVALAGASAQGTQAGATGKSRIAFARADGIYVMRPDGSGVRPLRRGSVAAGARALAWSPDGSALAFVDVNDAIWVIDADGTDLVRLVEASVHGVHGGGWSPTWLPDGRWVAFTQYDGKSRDRDIWIVNATGGNPQRLAETPYRFEWEVDWSPTGGRVAISTGGWAPNIYVMDANGKNVRTLTQEPRWQPKHFRGVEPDWSPNGRRIVFRDGSDVEAEIYVIDALGRSKVVLTSNDVYDAEPAWSPDGTKIAFVRSERKALCGNCPPARRSSSELYVMNADGTEETRLTDNGVGEASPAWQPIPRAP